MFLANASLFVDDAEAYEKYQREEEPEADESKVTQFVNFIEDYKLFISSESFSILFMSYAM